MQKRRLTATRGGFPPFPESFFLVALLLAELEDGRARPRKVTARKYKIKPAVRPRWITGLCVEYALTNWASRSLVGFRVDITAMEAQCKLQVEFSDARSDSHVITG